MSDTMLLPLEPAAALDVSHRNGNSLSNGIEHRAHYSRYSTLEQLPGFSTNLSIHTTGEEIGRLFSQQPDLPGVILFDENVFAGVISQAHYYKCISRAFGREIYHRRPSQIMLDELSVQSLILPSDCTIDFAVEQCLERPADYVYEPFLVHDSQSGQYLLCPFQMLLLASSQLATLRNRQMEQILNSVTDGLLVIDKDFRIGGEYSKVVGNIFERSDLHNLHLPDVLQPHLDSVTYEQLQDYLKILFDPKLIDRLIKSINPAKQISALFPSIEPRREKRIKHFSLNFERIRVQSEISQVLVRIEDITHRMALARELEEQEAAAEEKLHLVMQILQVEPDNLNRFLAHFDSALTAIAQLFQLENPTVDMIHNLFRQVHTLKGEASILRLSAHERALHQLEDSLEKIRSAPQPEVDALEAIRISGETLQKLSDQIHDALNQLKQLGVTARTNGHHPQLADNPGPTSLLKTLSQLISDLAERLGKSVVFHTANSDTDFPAEHREVLHEILIHLARNSMVHGIETTAERTARGKNPTGLIQLELRSHPDLHEIVFQDDGRGLDYERIKKRAFQFGWDLSTEDQLRNAIFEPGFSTADKVTELAGRGVGLDAIRHSLEKAGGRIIPYSETGSYCAFQILLPKVPTPPAA